MEFILLIIEVGYYLMSLVAIVWHFELVEESIKRM